MKGKKRRGSAITDFLPWLIISVAVLAIMFLFYSILSGNGVTFLEKIKNLFRGG